MDAFDEIVMYRYALSVGVAATLLAGCGVLRQAQDDMQPPIGVPGASAAARHLLPLSFQVLHSFGRHAIVSHNHGGAFADAGLIDVSGTLHGTTAYGGHQSNGVVYSISTTGVKRPPEAPTPTSIPALGVKWMGKVHPDHRKSWVSPAAKDAPRLYFASDQLTGDVYIFLMPTMKLVGTLTGFYDPQGECTDNKGNVYITNALGPGVGAYKFSRTGTLLATYADSYGYAVGCAWDPTTGNLAVTDLSDVKYPYQGDVLIYTSPSSAPTQLRNPDQRFYYFAGYDGHGNLWVDGLTANRSFILSACGPSSCSTLPTSRGTIYFPGNVQWDGARGTWVVFDQLCNKTNAACSYPVSERGSLGSPTTYTAYNGKPVCDLIQGVISADGKRYVAGGDNNYCTYSNSFDLWAYPGGGTPTHYTTRYAQQPVGAAISTK